VPALIVALVLALALACALLLGTRTPRIMLPLDGRAAAFLLRGAHAPERDGGRLFRWTSAATHLIFDRSELSSASELQLSVGGYAPGLAPATFDLEIDGAAFATLPAPTSPRVYHVLLPGRSWWNPQLDVTLRSAALAVPPDTRSVGLRLEGAGLRRLSAGVDWPPGALLAAQATLLAAVGALGRRLAWRAPTLGATLALAACLLFALVATQPLVAAIYTWRLALAGVALWLATLVVLPLVERFAHDADLGGAAVARQVWALMLVALAIRLVGALYPFYGAHDLELNVERLVRTIGGTLVSTNRSFEFRSGVTIYPPGPYLALVPALLASLGPGLLVQAGNAVVDGLGACATGLLALQLGAGRRAALLATLLYAAVPVMLTSLYWGHSAQVFGQNLMAPLALVLLHAFARPTRRLWLSAGALLACAFLSHIGVTILAIGWLGLAWVALRMRSTLAPGAWRQLTLMLAGAGLAGLALVYAPALALKVDQTAEVGQRVLRESYASQILISRAWLISFYPLGLPLAVAGLALAPGMLRMPRGGWELAGAWLVVALLFCLVELATGLQVRYFVFLAPLVCVSIGLALERLARLGGAWPALAWAVALALVVQGAAAWYNGVFNDIQMSMVPLLR
jgi:hypothetical protein